MALSPRKAVSRTISGSPGSPSRRPMATAFAVLSASASNPPVAGNRSVWGKEGGDDASARGAAPGFGAIDGQTCGAAAIVAGGSVGEGMGEGSGTPFSTAARAKGDGVGAGVGGGEARLSRISEPTPLSTPRTTT